MLRIVQICHPTVTGSSIASENVENASSRISISLLTNWCGRATEEFFHTCQASRVKTVSVSISALQVSRRLSQWLFCWVSTSSFWLRLVASYHQCLSQHCKLLSKLLSICHGDFSANFSLWFRLATIYHSVPISALQVGDFSANFSLWFRLATIYHSVPISALQVGDFSAVTVSLWFRLATIYHSVPISALQVGDFSAVTVSLWFRLATIYHSVPISALQVSDFSAVNFPLWFRLATVHYLTTFSVYLSIETSVSISDFHSVGGSVCVCVCACAAFAGLSHPFTVWKSKSRFLMWRPSLCKILPMLARPTSAKSCTNVPCPFGRAPGGERAVDKWRFSRVYCRLPTSLGMWGFLMRWQLKRPQGIFVTSMVSCLGVPAAHVLSI